MLIEVILSLTLVAGSPAKGEPSPTSPLISYVLGEKKEGYASHYGKTVMDKVLKNRGIQREEGMYYVASPYYPIGTLLLLESPYGHAIAEVADICAPNDCTAIRKRGVVVELEWRLAVILFPVLEKVGVGGSSERDSPITITVLKKREKP